MDAGKEVFDLVNEETGEIFTLNVASLVSDIRNVFLTKRREQTEGQVWSKISEDDQKDEIIQMGNLAKSVVFKVVEMVAEADRVCANVQITKFGVDVDKGEITITSKGFANDQALLDLNHSKGKVAMLTVVDTGQFNQRGDDPQPMPDEPEMFPIEDEDKAEANKAALKAAVADDPTPVAKKPAKKTVAAAANDALAAMPDDDDDLHAEAESVEDNTATKSESEPETSTEVDEPADVDKNVDPATAGQAARLAGSGPDENPFDGGTNEFSAWAEAYSAANDEIVGMVDEGYVAAMDGKPESSNPWKSKSDAAGFWAEGYAKGSKVKSEPADDSNDATLAGRRAAERGDNVDDNPHQEGAPHYRFWIDGFNSFEQPED